MSFDFLRFELVLKTSINLSSKATGAEVFENYF